MSPDPTTLDEGRVFAAMRGRRAVVVGDVMLDRFIGGSVARISPEAPVPVLRREEAADMPGGAANVARNLAHIGVRATLVGITGKDGHAALLRAALAEEPGIRFNPVVDAKRTTTVKTRFTAAGQQILRVDDEDTDPAPSALGKRVVAAAAKALRGCDLLVLSDYDKGVITPATASALIRLARKAGVPVLADPKKSDPAVFAGADIITPNLEEAGRLFGISAGDRAELSRSAARISARHRIDAVLVTLGPDGMLLVGKGRKPHHARSAARSVFDVSGAGDTVIAMLAAAMAAGADVETAARLANAAAGVVVGKAGTATVTPGEVLAELAPTADTGLEAAAPQLEEWRRQGLAIGFTNGCFDLLHPGHVHLLAKAAATCERLVVGLNSDASARALKGPGRPLQSQGRRAAVLASLPMVDSVVVFDERTPARLIRRIHPDRLVKGGDYKPKDVVGRDTVTARGGKVVIVPLVDGYSTTRLGDPAS